jgi:hypothetical protein
MLLILQACIVYVLVVGGNYIRVWFVLGCHDHPSGVRCRNGSGSQGFRRVFALFVFDNPTLRIFANLWAQSEVGLDFF